MRRPNPGAILLRRRSVAFNESLSRKRNNIFAGQWNCIQRMGRRSFIWNASLRCEFSRRPRIGSAKSICARSRAALGTDRTISRSVAVEIVHILFGGQLLPFRTAVLATAATMNHGGVFFEKVRGFGERGGSG